MPIKLLSWNVNGLRACERGGFSRWFSEQAADVVCLQEIKVRPEQLPPELVHPGRYHSFWHPAEKPGYSGTVIFSKKEPVSIRYGIGVKDIDREGRVLIAEFKNFTVMNAYFPNSQRDHARLGYKLKFCEAFAKFSAKERKKGKTVLMCGDFNIAHNEIDLKNPKTNKDNAGFLPEERAWMTEFLNQDYVDTFRHFHKDPGHYTWWSYRPGVRERNIGWRLDYFLVNGEAKKRLKSAAHQHLIKGSDHCPVALEIST
jgi:exodeoxyribonuclease III